MPRVEFEAARFEPGQAQTTEMDGMAAKSTSSQVFDSVIIGGGPAGMSAAIYLGRALRSTLVIDAESPGRTEWAQQNHNLFGFPGGIPIRDLADRGRKQAQEFGATFLNERVSSIEKEAGNLFRVRAKRRIYRARTVVICTGVTDRWVEFPGSEACIGRSMHWCIVCDGYEMQGQRVLVVGNDAEAVEEARQLKHFTKNVGLLLEPGVHTVKRAGIAQLEADGVALFYGRIADATCRRPGMCVSVETEQGEVIAVDHIFSVLGSVPNVDLALQLGLKLNKDGLIKVDTEARTSIAGVFAAGDVTRLFSHQVVAAAHEGATAGMAIAADLWTHENLNS